MFWYLKAFHHNGGIQMLGAGPPKDLDSDIVKVIHPKDGRRLQSSIVTCGETVELCGTWESLQIKKQNKPKYETKQNKEPNKTRNKTKQNKTKHKQNKTK